MLRAELEMRAQLTQCSSSADLEFSKAEEWYGQSGDVWSDLANHHDLLGVGGDEFGRHFDDKGINSQ